MAYDYSTQRAMLFTERGLNLVLAAHDRVRKLTDVAGAVRMDKAMEGCLAGDNWTSLACIDFLVERGELREVTPSGVAGQHRVFVPSRDYMEKS